MTIIYFILMLSIIVTVHELGHLFTAKFFNVYCHEFAFGMGPKIWSKQGKETTYSIRALPFGGFVRMAGEEVVEGDPEVPEERQLTGIAPYKRMIIMLSGILMNLLTAILISAVIYGCMEYYVQYPKPIITTVKENYPAEIAGFQPGDEIVSITFKNGMEVKPTDSYIVMSYMQAFPQEATYEVKRGKEKISLTVAPVYDETAQRYYIGVEMPEVQVKEVTIWNAGYYGFLYTKDIVIEVVNTFTNLIKGKGLENLSGPIGLYQLTEDTMSEAESSLDRIIYFANLVVILSANVAIFNLIPVPLFDGGRVVLCFAEIIAGHRLKEETEEKLMLISVILVIALFIFVMINDISRIFG